MHHAGASGNREKYKKRTAAAAVASIKCSKTIHFSEKEQLIKKLRNEIINHCIHLV